MRVAFMGTPEFSVPSLELLVESEYEIAAVYTQPDRPAGRSKAPVPSPVKQVALRYGLQLFQPLRMKDPLEVERLAGLGPELIIVAAFGQILPQSVLDIPRFGCLNVHPSLLPKYRGASPVPAPILAGDEETGVTIMLMDAGMDTGPVLSQNIVDIMPDETAGSLASRLAHAGARLLMETIPLWIDGSLKPQPQDGSRATYTKPIRKEDGRIDWRMPAEEISRRVRAFNPWPGSYTYWNDKMLHIVQAVPLGDGAASKSGTVIALPPGQPAAAGVKTGSGTLGLIDVQLEGKRVMTVPEFVRGQRSFVGSVLH